MSRATPSWIPLAGLLSSLKAKICRTSTQQRSLSLTTGTLSLSSRYFRNHKQMSYAIQEPLLAISGWAVFFLVLLFFARLDYSISAPVSADKKKNQIAFGDYYSRNLFLPVCFHEQCSLIKIRNTFNRISTISNLIFHCFLQIKFLFSAILSFDK